MKGRLKLHSVGNSRVRPAQRHESKAAKLSRVPESKASPQPTRTCLLSPWRQNMVPKQKATRMVVKARVRSVAGRAEQRCVAGWDGQAGGIPWAPAPSAQHATEAKGTSTQLTVLGGPVVDDEVAAQVGQQLVAEAGGRQRRHLQRLGAGARLHVLLHHASHLPAGVLQGFHIKAGSIRFGWCCHEKCPASAASAQQSRHSHLARPLARYDSAKSRPRAASLPGLDTSSILRGRSGRAVEGCNCLEAVQRQAQPTGVLHAPLGCARLTDTAAPLHRTDHQQHNHTHQLAGFYRSGQGGTPLMLCVAGRTGD